MYNTIYFVIQNRKGLDAMARKLSREELERFKADFDPPAYPAADKKEMKDTARAAGRPRKREGDTRPVSFRLPESTIKKLRVAAIMRDVSPADLIIEFVDGLEVGRID